MCHGEAKLHLEAATVQFQGLLVTRNRVQASPLPMHKKLILAGLGLDCERGVLAAGATRWLAPRPFFPSLPFFPLVSSGRYCVHCLRDGAG